MLHRRILYLVTLAAVFAFQVTNSNYLARLLLALCLALPLLSLSLGAVGMRGCRLVLSARPARVTRGEEAQWLITAESRSGLPVSRLTLRLECINPFTGTKERKKMVLTGVSPRTISLPADTTHCGLLELRVKRLRAYDYLGLFSFRRPLPEPVRLPVMPAPSDPGPLNLPEGLGQRAAAGSPARQTRSEDYDLRDYRPGDPMRAVHWKLSSKWDELIVREPADTLVPLPLLTFDLFGSPEELDRTLDRLAGYSHAMLAVQRPHGIVYLLSGTPRFHTVSSEKELSDCLLSILSVSPPLTGVSLAEQPELAGDPGTPVFRLHVSGRKEEDA